MTGIFERLNYDFTPDDENLLEFSDKAVEHLNTFPALLDDWQLQDMENGEVGDYFINPVANVVNNIIAIADDMYLATLGVTSNGGDRSIALTTIRRASLNTATRANSTNSGLEFVRHTNRISGVTPYDASIGTSEDPNIGDKPHYDTAIAAGKAVMYLSYQSDGVENTAPIIGSFTSLFISNTLNTINTTYHTDYDTFNNSLFVGDDGDGNTTTYSSLTLSELQSIANNANSTLNLLIERREHDEQFYLNTQDVVKEYQALKLFKRPGETESKIFQKIGSPKLLSRINS